jgi:hypothetical protein
MAGSSRHGRRRPAIHVLRRCPLEDVYDSAKHCNKTALDDALPPIITSDDIRTRPIGRMRRPARRQAPPTRPACPAPPRQWTADLLRYSRQLPLRSSTSSAIATLAIRAHYLLPRQPIGRWPCDRDHAGGHEFRAVARRIAAQTARYHRLRRHRGRQAESATSISIRVAWHACYPHLTRFLTGTPVARAS